MNINPTPPRRTLTPGVEEVFEFRTDFATEISILNVGPGDVYFALDTTATVDGDNCIMVPEGMGRTYSKPCKSVHVISDSAAYVQVDGLR